MRKRREGMCSMKHFSLPGRRTGRERVFRSESRKRKNNVKRPNEGREGMV